MKRLTAAALILCFSATSAFAALSVGAKAPEITTLASKGGKQFDFVLSKALKNGPVVLYFFPKAYTKGCDIEAHEFAEASDKFAKQNATVIGISRDTIAVLEKYSTEKCRDKFAVASDADGKATAAYDAAIKDERFKGAAISGRISYVIAPDSTILHVLDTPDPYKHIEESLDAVTRYKDGNRKPVMPNQIP